MAEVLRLAAVIPAAGLSSRMGAFKPLLPYGGGTVIEASAANALAAADQAVIVLGKRGDQIRELLSRRFGDRLIFAENPDYASTDMLCSVRIGLKAVKGIIDAFCIAPADMPAISPEVYSSLARSFHDDEILIPTVHGKRGHPPLISARLIPEILCYDGTDGLRGFYREHKVREIPVDDKGALTDIDTPEDYRALKSKLT